MPDTTPEPSINFLSAIFVKTPLGQQEVATRALGLPPLTRRLLILVDGKRSGQELAVFANGQAVDDLLQDLLRRQCVAVVGSLGVPDATPSRAPATPSPSNDAGLAGLPPAESRSALELKMAQNFMINSVNMAFGQHMCMSLIKAVDDSTTTPQLRAVYPEWLRTMAASSAAGDLPTLKDKLFRVL